MNFLTVIGAFTLFFVLVGALLWSIGWLKISVTKVDE